MTELLPPPHNDDAEVCVLSAILERNSLIDDLESIIRAEDFYRLENQTIYRRMMAMALVSQPIDPVTLYSALEAAGEDRIVSAEYVAEIAINGRGSHNAVHYARILKEKAIDRRLITKGREISELGYSDGTAAEKMDKAQSIVMEESEASAGEAVDANTALRDLVEHLDYLNKNKGKLMGISTGFVDLDNLTNGLQESDMVVIAGRPSMGKTTLAMNIAEHAAVNEKKVVVVFSLEMPIRQLMLRSACSLGRMPMGEIKRGNMDELWSQITATVARIKDAPLYIDDRPGLTSEQLLSRCRKLQKRIGRKIDLIVIDYLTLMADKGEGVERVTRISGNVKRCAREMNCPVICISQLSRKVEERGDKRPMNSDLRDSGAIEQDADVIGFVYRDEAYNKEKSNMKGVAELIISKHRNGELGTVYLTSRLQYCRFDNNCGYVPPQQAPKPYRRGGFTE